MNTYNRSCELILREKRLMFKEFSSCKSIAERYFSKRGVDRQVLMLWMQGIHVHIMFICSAIGHQYFPYHHEYYHNH